MHDNVPDMLERFLVGEEYIADHPEIVRRNRRAMELADRFNRVWASDPEAGESILRELLGGIGENTTVRAPIQIDYGTNLTIGSRTFINFGLTALDVVPITIGDDVQMGPTSSCSPPRIPSTRSVGSPAGNRANPSRSKTDAGSAAVSSCALASRSAGAASSARVPSSRGTSRRSPSPSGTQPGSSEHSANERVWMLRAAVVHTSR